MKNRSKTGPFNISSSDAKTTLITATKANSSASPRPGIRMRGLLAEAYDLRGHTGGKLWTQYSAKARRDVAFASELAYLHFLYVESSFDVMRIDYAPTLKVTRAVGSNFVDLVKVEIVMASGEVVWRSTCHDDQADMIKQAQSHLQLLLQSTSMPDGQVTPRLELLTHTQMLSSPLRIRNWHAIAAWLAAGRDWALTDVQLEVAALIRRRGRVEFQEVLALGGGTDRDDLYGVALFRSLQAGAYRSNLFDAPFTLRTVISEKKVAA